jgi:hypothetical protein
MATINEFQDLTGQFELEGKRSRDPHVPVEEDLTEELSDQERVGQGLEEEDQGRWDSGVEAVSFMDFADEETKSGEAIAADHLLLVCV